MRKLTTAPDSTCLQHGFVAAVAQVRYTLNEPWGSCNGITREIWPCNLPKVLALQEEVLAQGYDEVYLPIAMGNEYPNAKREWSW